MKYFKFSPLIFVGLLYIAATTAHADGGLEIDAFAIGSNTHISTGGEAHTLTAATGPQAGGTVSSGGTLTLSGGYRAPIQPAGPPPSPIPGVTSIGLWVLAAALAVLTAHTLKRRSPG